MDGHRTEAPTSIQDEPSLWISSLGPTSREWIGGCPYATTLKAYSVYFDSWILIALACKRWGCSHCGKIRVAMLSRKVALAKPTKLITLTIDPKLHETPRDAYDATRRKLPDFTKAIRKQIGEFEYVRVLEVTKAGWPHYHLLARCGYIKQKVISNVWARSTGAPIVDIRQIKKGANVYNYIVKYLGKQEYVPWTNRRVSWSKGFFPDETPPEKADWQLEEKEHLKDPVPLVIAKEFGESEWEKCGAYAIRPTPAQNQRWYGSASDPKQLDPCIESCGKLMKVDELPLESPSEPF